MTMQWVTLPQVSISTQVKFIQGNCILSWVIIPWLNLPWVTLPRVTLLGYLYLPRLIFTLGALILSLKVYYGPIFPGQPSEG